MARDDINELYDLIYDIGVRALLYGASTVFLVGVGSVTVHECNSMGVGPTSRLENQLVRIEDRISSLETKIQQHGLVQERAVSEGVYAPEGVYILPSTEEGGVLPLSNELP